MEIFGAGYTKNLKWKAVIRGQVIHIGNEVSKQNRAVLSGYMYII